MSKPRTCYFHDFASHAETPRIWQSLPVGDTSTCPETPASKGLACPDRIESRLETDGRRAKWVQNVSIRISTFDVAGAAFELQLISRFPNLKSLTVGDVPSYLEPNQAWTNLKIHFDHASLLEKESFKGAFDLTGLRQLKKLSITAEQECVIDRSDPHRPRDYGVDSAWRPTNLVKRLPARLEHLKVKGYVFRWSVDLAGLVDDLFGTAGTVGTQAHHSA
ncbi:hypothetical protein CLCR_10337 [Cladophialophora carrionii]|uniref:Uncharacterized protein n=1 Tax=Cladophialophora carrionii TaxID=86049 RepID=A0A1C1CYI1_9EURO|nr:hypothetical protein CLCR_10337 [Cladophialophora carrionii]